MQTFDDPSTKKYILNIFLCIFMLVHKEFLLSVDQVTDIRRYFKKIIPNTKIEYIHILTADRIQISNSLVFLNLI